MTETPETREAVVELLADALNGGARDLPMPGYVQDSEAALKALADAGLALVRREGLARISDDKGVCGNCGAWATGEGPGLTSECCEHPFWTLQDYPKTACELLAADLLRDDDGEG